jgi:coenzyme F420-0:L-glutamate ligase/coenzyme F420-1:gamma-L-glutamate ligase
MPNSGLDRSNANNKTVLLPLRPYTTAFHIREHLSSRFNLTNLGVIITDSEVSNFRNGSIGFAIGYAGFIGYQDYRGEFDLYNRMMKVSISNVVDKLASTAVLEMGEGNEQIPIVIIEEVKSVTFNIASPSKDEIDLLKKDYSKFPFNV